MTTKINIKNAVLALLLIASSTLCFAQCDKTVTLTALKTNYYDAQDKLLKSDDETSMVTISKTSVSITPGSNSKVSGPVSSYICSWTKPYKEGKMVVKCKLLNENNVEKNATITIEAKEGKVNLTFEALEMPGRKIKLVADKFE